MAHPPGHCEQHVGMRCYVILPAMHAAPSQPPILVEDSWKITVNLVSYTHPPSVTAHDLSTHAGAGLSSVSPQLLTLGE